MPQNRSTAVMQRRVDPGEEWREVDLWEGYEVSDLGRVRSWKQRCPGRVWLPRYDMEPRILRQESRNGYRAVLLSEKGKGVFHASVHRLVLLAFAGPCPEGWHGAHIDGDKTNNCRQNLRWCSPKENNADKLRHGTHLSGENIGSAKLTAEEARSIIRLRASGEKVGAIAERFNVCRNTVTNITRGRSWRSLVDGSK